MENNAVLIVLIWAIIIRIIMIKPNNILKRTLWPTCYSVLALYIVSGLYNTIMIVLTITFPILYAVALIKIANYLKR